MRLKREAHAPPAHTAVLHLIKPLSVTTPEMAPAVVSRVRTAQPSIMLTPIFCTARASAGTARSGSARPSLSVVACAIVDPTGRIVARTAEREKTVLVSDVPLIDSDTTTPYLRFGDWFGWLSLGLLALGSARLRLREADNQRR